MVEGTNKKIKPNNSNNSSSPKRKNRKSTRASSTRNQKKQLKTEKDEIMPTTKTAAELPQSTSINDKYGKVEITPSRWFSIEMYIFYIALIMFFVYPLALFSPIARKVCDENPRCTHYLRDSWIGSMDLADDQWREFRNNIPILIAASISFLLISRSVRHYCNVQMRLVWYTISSIFYIWLISGVGGTVIVVLITTINFGIGKSFGNSKFNPIVTWGFGVILMYMNEFHRDKLKLRYLFGSTMAIYDRPGILNIPTQMYMRFIFLRMVSFNVDYYWALNGTGGKASGWHLKQLERYTEKERDDIASGGGPYGWREKSSRPLSDYNYMAYLSSIFYIPLMLTGPILPFNAFISYVHKMQNSMNTRSLSFYCLRLGISFLLLEIFAHYYPVIAICKSGAYSSMKPHELAALVYVTLKTMWLKFLILWRFFRTWSLFDGIEPVENMNRCMSNNWTLQGFWKSWHRSFNRWLVRYIYIPIGGSRFKYVNVFVVFTFVALWHDMNFQLLAWGWITGVTFLPEMAIGVMFKKITALKALKRKSYYRFIVAFGGAGNILLLMAANMIGYSVGVSGTGNIAAAITWGHFLLFIYVYTCLYLGVIFMQEWRAEERRQGIIKQF